MLITLISGILFYKNLTQIGSSRNLLKLDFNELRTLDLKIKIYSLQVRYDLNADFSELQEQKLKIDEISDLLSNVNKNSPELNGSIKKIKKHYKDQQIKIELYLKALIELRDAVNSLIPAYNQLEKNNLKYILDKKDFYRECVLDSYMFLAFSHQDNENRLKEDIKILSQIVNYADLPSPFLQKFSKSLENIRWRVKDLDKIGSDFKETNITSEINIISKYYEEILVTESKQNENLLTFVLFAVGIYLIFMIFILRKK
jgi:hypothetical protein